MSVLRITMEKQLLEKLRKALVEQGIIMPVEKLRPALIDICKTYHEWRLDWENKEI